MSTSDSPPAKIEQEANRIAVMLKRASRGQRIADDPQGRIAKSLEKGVLDFAVVQDDKVIKIVISWDDIRKHSIPELRAYIAGLMQGEIPARTPGEMPKDLH